MNGYRITFKIKCLTFLSDSTFFVADDGRASGGASSFTQTWQ